MIFRDTIEKWELYDQLTRLLDLLVGQTCSSSKEPLSGPSSRTARDINTQ